MPQRPLIQGLLAVICALGAGCSAPMGAIAPAEPVVAMPLQAHLATAQRGVLAAPDDAEWNMRQIARSGYRLQAEAGNRVVVAVLDTGVDATHPELAGRLYPGIDVVGTDRLTLRGATTDFTGRDGNGHGTHVAGIVARVGAGLNVHILPVKVIPNSGIGDDRRLTDGIDRALAWRDPADPSVRVRVLNLSVSSPQYSERLKGALRRASEAGVLVVGASGNGGAAVEFPASVASVLAVGATGPRDVPQGYSGRGAQVALSAPGGSDYEPVVSAWPSYLTSSDYEAGMTRVHLTAGLVGTSMAAPHVSATAAALWSRHPHLSARQVRASLLGMADDIGTPGHDADSGFGRLNFARALEGDRHDAH